LDFAEAQGLSPAFSCRNGICNTCLCSIEGEVRYVEEPLEMPQKGQALLCCSVPDGPVRLRL
jgi:ferredoxin